MTKFEPTEKQLSKWSLLRPTVMPSDDEFKARWKRAHGGKVTGWGMTKRDWVIAHSDDHLTCTVEYNLGLWQGRVDAMNGDPQQETPEYHTDPYQYGYYHGYAEFDGFWRGYDAAAKSDLQAKFGNR